LKYGIGSVIVFISYLFFSTLNKQFNHLAWAYLVWRIILHTELDVLRNLLVVSSVTLVLIICHSCRLMKLLQRVINFLVGGNKPKHLEEGTREYGNSKGCSIIGEIAPNMHHRASICSIHPNASDRAQSSLSTQRHRL